MTILYCAFDYVHLVILLFFESCLIFIFTPYIAMIHLHDFDIIPSLTTFLKSFLSWPLSFAFCPIRTSNFTPLTCSFFLFWFSFFGVLFIRILLHDYYPVNSLTYLTSMRLTSFNRFITVGGCQNIYLCKVNEIFSFNYITRVPCLSKDVLISF